MLNTQDDFSFYLPVDIVKSGNSKKEMRIAGFASTPDEDRQGDNIIQTGLDISDFVNYGWLNYDHDNSKILGYPDKAKTKLSKQGFYIEGIFLDSNPLAVDLYNLSVSLQNSNAPRRLGFSVEGKILQRDAYQRISKAKVFNVAVTPNPVNPKATWSALVKSFTSSTPLDKACEAGYTSAIGEVTSGASLKPESLDRAFRTLAKALGGDEEASKSLNFLKEQLCLQKSVDTDDITLYFQLFKGMSRTAAETLTQEIIKQQND